MSRAPKANVPESLTTEIANAVSVVNTLDHIQKRQLHEMLVRHQNYMSEIPGRNNINEVHIKVSDDSLFNCKSYPFPVMPLDLCNTVAEFTRCLDKTMGEECPSFARAYVDDILITSKTLDEHIQHIHIVLTKHSLTKTSTSRVLPPNREGEIKSKRVCFPAPVRTQMFPDLYCFEPERNREGEKSYPSQRRWLSEKRSCQRAFHNLTSGRKLLGGTQTETGNAGEELRDECSAEGCARDSKWMGKAEDSPPGTHADDLTNSPLSKWNSLTEMRSSSGIIKKVLRVPVNRVSIVSLRNSHLLRHSAVAWRRQLRFAFAASLTCGGRGDVVVRPLASHSGELATIACGVAPGSSHVIILPNDVAGLPFPPPKHSGDVHTHLTSPSSALKTKSLHSTITLIVIKGLRILLLRRTRCRWVPTSTRAAGCHSITDKSRGIGGGGGTARLYKRGRQSDGHVYPSTHSGSLTAQGAAAADRLRAPVMRDDNARGEDPPRVDPGRPSPRHRFRGRQRPRGAHTCRPTDPPSRVRRGARQTHPRRSEGWCLIGLEFRSTAENDFYLDGDEMDRGVRLNPIHNCSGSLRFEVKVRPEASLDWMLIGRKPEEEASGKDIERLHHLGPKLDPRLDLRTTHKTVAPFEFRAVHWRCSSFLTAEIGGSKSRPETSSDH
ncbi:hypothetical protein PR048_023275 [Dryococelus australis]|uniref:Reverse transcriptase domain-containing protein n=1 Tax=Dryococelus australis TaxID=614101 RepID=A0ABQ9GTM2_9NEOP|nr:hypothetical protein PR048_023275 [Dryococelus australis]